MKLTGKALKAFEAWLGNKNFDDWDSILDLNGLSEYPESMQWGVIQDWGDSVGISIATENSTHLTDIEMEVWDCYQDKFEYTIIMDDLYRFCSNSKEYTRPEAQAAAIEKLDEIFNKRK